MKGIIFLIFILFLTGNAFSQQLSNHRYVGKKYAKNDLKKMTNDSSKYNVSKIELMLPNKRIATNYADSILFLKYGKEDILDEKPYEMYLIDNYWWVRGTMEKGRAGGTFKLVINAINKEVVYLSHGK